MVACSHGMSVPLCQIFEVVWIGMRVGKLLQETPSMSLGCNRGWAGYSSVSRIGHECHPRQPLKRYLESGVCHIPLLVWSGDPRKGRPVTKTPPFPMVTFNRENHGEARRPRAR